MSAAPSIAPGPPAGRGDTPAGEALSMAGLRKSYGAVRALDRVDLDVAGGSFVTLLGPSGSGKTTLLMALAGLVELDAGTITVGGRRLEHAPPHKRGLGVVFQNYALFPHMNVRDNIFYPLRTRGMRAAQGIPAIERALELVRLAGYGDRQVDQLSGGQKQRIALARALVFAPPVLLLDEPLSALDRNLREEMQIELRQLHLRLGTTMIMVTHDQEEALALSDHIAIMDRGRIVQQGAPRDVYAQPNSRFVAGFIGRSHLLPVTVQGGVACWNGIAVPTRRPAEADDVCLVVRPELLVPLPASAGSDPALGEAVVFDGVVRATSYRGDATVTIVALPDGSEFHLRQPSLDGIAVPAPGTAMRLGLRRQDAELVKA
ncbi:polyamine-transporting ATPase [Allostella vacuolata]|nr:polyamine-transporting ATPase [Stella vacuolata]